MSSRLRSYTYLLVAGDQTTLSATRITSIASFTATLTAAAMGVVVRYIRVLKPVVILGFCIEVLAFGLMIRYRDAGASKGDLAVVQLVRGFGSGCIGFPVQAAIQSVTKHESEWFVIIQVFPAQADPGAFLLPQTSAQSLRESLILLLVPPCALTKPPPPSAAAT